MGNTNGIRIVALDGSVIQPNGNISGGFFAKKNHRSMFNLKDKAKKQKNRDELLEKLRQIDDELVASEDGDDDDDDDGKQNVDEYELENSLNDLQNKKKNKEFRMETMRKQLKEKSDALAATQQSLKELKKKLKKKKKEAE